MLEFGSDFHYCTDIDLSIENKLSQINARFFANGRQALQAIIRYNSWKRIWIPEYFCYEIIEILRKDRISIELYPDAPTFDDVSIISNISFKEGDVLLRMNFFGLRTWRDNSGIPVAVIEDHSHDLVGNWSTNSNADWIIASLRKTLPIPEGGILWSPKNLELPSHLLSSIQNDELTYKRLSAMLLKRLYLKDQSVPKEIYRQMFIETEESFSTLELSSISSDSFLLFQHFDIDEWYSKKNKNWSQLTEIERNNICILEPENITRCNPFSMIIQFRNKLERDLIYRRLIENEIYSAILWKVPDNSTPKVKNMSDTLISVHCDARYNESDIEFLKCELIKLIKLI